MRVVRVAEFSTWRNLPPDVLELKEGAGAGGLPAGRHRCPRCGHAIFMTFGPAVAGGENGVRAPVWTLTGPDDAPTVKASILHVPACDAHYFIEAGEIVWA